MPPLMTLKQVSDVVFDNDSNANCQTIRRFIERGHFPAPKIPAINRGGSAYFSKDEVSQWFQKELIDYYYKYCFFGHYFWSILGRDK